jgi:hypothetical protein
LAAGNEPHDSQRIGVGWPAVNNPLAVTIFTLVGFTIKNNENCKICQPHDFGVRILTVYLQRYLLDYRRYELCTLRSTFQLRTEILLRDGADKQLIHHGSQALISGRMTDSGDFDVVTPPRNLWWWATYLFIIFSIQHTRGRTKNEKK